MELNPTGRLITWLGLGLLIVGFFFSNTAILLVGTLLPLYLLLEGISFHRAVETAKGLIKLESHPTRIETTAGRQVRIETFIANHSRSSFHIVGFTRNVPPQIGDEVPPSMRLALSSGGVRRIETSLKTMLPGYFELSTSTISLEGRAGLFRQGLRIRDKVTITAQPVIKRSVDPINVGVLADLAVDHLRRGSGTDLAGIRPFIFPDNYRSIDWKATARMGKLMTREMYLERDPTVILMIDVSCVKTSRCEMAILPSLLSGVGNLLKTFPLASPVGLILYDNWRVIANIEARQGANSREEILRTLLERVQPTAALEPLERAAIRPYADLVRETNSLMKESAFPAKTNLYWERFSSLANSILPFYKRAESKYFTRLRKQGAFKAFEVICTHSEPELVIVISHDETNLYGLAEGAKNAKIMNHQVVLTILSAFEPTKRLEVSPDPESEAVHVLRCRPDELSRAINAEILKLSRRRTIAIDAAR